MATDTERLSLLRDAVDYIRVNYIGYKEKELAAADLCCPPEYGGGLNPEVMRLRARAAVWRRVASELDDILNDPIYRESTASGGLSEETGIENSSRKQ
jgi:hypothetical protein